MNNKCFTYIKIDEQQSCIYTTGMTFKEFIFGMKPKINNILILSGFPEVSNWNRKLCLEYIKKEKLNDFYEEDVYSYGDFCWVDFENESDLNNVTKEELASLLYMAHLKEKLNDFKIKSLNNKYAYLCHDDEYSVKIYMQNTKKYKKVIQYKILKELQGKKKMIAKIPDDIMDTLYDYFKQGAVIDFERAYLTGVNIYIIGDYFDIDLIHKKLDSKRNVFNNCNLDYNRKNKKWSIRGR